MNWRDDLYRDGKTPDQRAIDDAATEQRALMRPVAAQVEPPVAEVRVWALWHPTKGFGHYVDVSTYMDDAIADRHARTALDDDPQWKVVPVLVKLL
jgi:hypothetical protein